jgi:hypothetical protein
MAIAARPTACFAKKFRPDFNTGNPCAAIAANFTLLVEHPGCGKLCRFGFDACEPWA